MAYREITFPSSTGLGDIFVREWLVDDPKAIIQMVHGMAEHGERYAEMAEYFNIQGFSFVIDDHMGHGKSISEGKEENQAARFSFTWRNARRDPRRAARDRGGFGAYVGIRCVCDITPSENKSWQGDYGALGSTEYSAILKMG